MEKEVVLILDLGSQYTQLIAKTTRRLGVYSEILPYNVSIEEIREFNPGALILSGSPSSVNGTDAPFPDRGILELGIPILGICYGMQLLSYWFDGVVSRSTKKEYGKSLLQAEVDNPLFKGLNDVETVWMSHGDSLSRIPEHFDVIARSDNSPYAAIHHKDRSVFGLQFHPESVLTPSGKRIIRNWVEEVEECTP